MKPSGRLLLFLGITMPALCLLPALNLAIAPKIDLRQILHRDWLFNVDAVARYWARIAYPLGVSTDPRQVIVGRDGWLHLGDEYETTISLKRRPPTPSELTRVEQVREATLAWDRLLKAHGVQAFSVMVGPDKSSVYPETLPEWAQPVGPNISDALLLTQAAPLHIDLRAALFAARSQHSALLYYRTDTHWTELGAAVAYSEFARQVAPFTPGLRWLDSSRLRPVGATPRGGGDLARFLRLSGYLRDTSPRISLSDETIETQVVDFETGHVMSEDARARLNDLSKPFLVRSPSALNEKKLLWLRDSFGKALSPMMAATFRQTLQIHWRGAFRPGELQRLVDRFRPDYVFVTVVERDVTSKGMATFPTPSDIRSIGPERLAAGAKATRVAGTTAHAASATVAGDSNARGFAPARRAFWTSDSDARRRWLALSLVCADGSTSVPLQIGWTAANGSSSTAHVVLPSGPRAIDLWSLPGWPIGQAVPEVGLTLDVRAGCLRFALDGPVRLDHVDPER